MDIRSYFKGDDTTPKPPPPPPPPKSPPRPTILELPDFLFVSAASGVKRSRSTVPENVDDVDKSDHFNSNLHRVLSPLEVRVMPPTTKPANEITPTNNTTTKRKKSKSNKNDGFYFSDDLDDKLAMFAAHKEKLKRDKEEVETNKKKKPLKYSKEFEKLELKTNSSSNNNKASHIPLNNQTTPPATTPPKPPQPVSPIPLIPPILPVPPKQSPIKSFPSPSNPKPKENPAPKKVVVDLELEDKIQQKMDVVQLWQTKCSDLRKQLAHATSQLSQSLDELDHLNSLYEESNH